MIRPGYKKNVNCSAGHEISEGAIPGNCLSIETNGTGNPRMRQLLGLRRLLSEAQHELEGVLCSRTPGM